MAIKAAVTAAADDSTRKKIGVVICSALLVVPLPLIAFMSLMSGGAEHNRKLRGDRVQGGSGTGRCRSEICGYIEKIRNMFTRLDI